MKLSELKVGDKFNFLPNQKGGCTYPSSRTTDYRELPNTPIYEVIKTHKKSQECTVLGGSLRIQFRTSGVIAHNHYINLVDPEVKLFFPDES